MSLSSLSLLSSMKEGKSLTSKRFGEPEFLLSTPDERIVNIFEVRISALQGQSAAGGNVNQFYVFGSITDRGTVSLWDYAGRRKYWELKTDLEQVVHGEILLNEEGDQPPTLIIQSRVSGIHMFQFKEDLMQGNLSKGAKLPFGTHIGFCRMTIQSQLLFFPILQSSFGVTPLNSLQQYMSDEISSSEDPACKIETGSSIMFLKVFKSSCGDEFVLYGMEDGTVKVATVYATSCNNITDAAKVTSWESQIQLNQCGTITGSSNNREDDELVTPICVEFSRKNGLVVLGTNTKSLYILKLDYDQVKLSFQGKKSLINKGVNCMQLHLDGKLMTTGGWDGVIRVFAFPSMNQLMAINYHKSAIVTLHFVNKSEEESSRKYFLLCGAEDGQISCWNLHSKLTKE